MDSTKAYFKKWVPSTLPPAPFTGSLGICPFVKGKASVLGRTLGVFGPGVHDPGSPLMGFGGAGRGGL